MIPIPEKDLVADRARVLADLAAGKSPEAMVVTMEPRALYPSPVVTSSVTTEKEAAGPPVRVRIVAPYRVQHAGRHFVGGQTTTVPAATAEHWIKMKWAEPVKKGKN